MYTSYIYHAVCEVYLYKELIILFVGVPKAYDPKVLDLLQSCGSDLIAYTQQERHCLLDRVWMSLLKASKIYI